MVVEKKETPFATFEAIFLWEPDKFDGILQYCFNELGGYNVCGFRVIIYL